MRILTMGALPPLQWEGWGGDGVIMHGKDGSFPHPLPVLPIANVAVATFPLKGEKLLWQNESHRNLGIFSRGNRLSPGAYEGRRTYPRAHM